MVYTDKDEVRVVVVTSAHRIEGDMHLLKDSRLTDLLNSKAKDFFALTNATVFDLSGGDAVYEAEYVAVSRSSISIIFPI